LRLTFENRDVLGVDSFEFGSSNILEDLLEIFLEIVLKIDFLGGLAGGCIRPFLPNNA